MRRQRGPRRGALCGCRGEQEGPQRRRMFAFAAKFKKKDWKIDLESSRFRPVACPGWVEHATSLCSHSRTRKKGRRISYIVYRNTTNTREGRCPIRASRH
eukprot:5731353-Prymnesium_polylepis.1